MNANKKKYMPLVIAAGQKHGIDPNIIAGLIDTENDTWDPGRHTGGDSSAVGLGQFTKGTAKRYGVVATDAASSIDGTARYLADLKKRYKGDMSLAVRAYHDGEGSVDELLAGRTNAITSRAESREYTAKVFAAAKRNGAGDLVDNATALTSGAAPRTAKAAAPTPAPQASLLPQAAPAPALTTQLAAAGQPAAQAPEQPMLQPAQPASAMGASLLPETGAAQVAAAPQQLFMDGGGEAPNMDRAPSHLTDLLQEAVSQRGPRLAARRPSAYDSILDSILG